MRSKARSYWCTSPFLRFNHPGEIQVAGPGGNVVLRPDLVAHAIHWAGQSWTFQAWYRDSDHGVPRSNLTSAVRLTLN